MDFAVLAGHWVKLKESKKRHKYLDLARELRKLWNMKVTVILIVIGTLSTGTGGLGNKRMCRNHPNNSIIKIDQNPEKSPGDSGKFTVTQTPVINHQLTLEWKTLERLKLK